MADRDSMLEERLADRRLRQLFGELARPQLSPFFEAQLRQRVARERQRRLMRRCGRVMAAYWLAVVLASSGILFFLPWPAVTPSSMLQAALLLVVVTTVGPVWVLLRVSRASFIDIIVGTLER